jgi:hypothetical protein
MHCSKRKAEAPSTATVAPRVKGARREERGVYAPPSGKFSEKAGSFQGAFSFDHIVITIQMGEIIGVQGCSEVGLDCAAAEDVVVVAVAVVAGVSDPHRIPLHPPLPSRVFHCYPIGELQRIHNLQIEKKCDDCEVSEIIATTGIVGNDPACSKPLFSVLLVLHGKRTREFSSCSCIPPLSSHLAYLDKMLLISRLHS